MIVFCIVIMVLCLIWVVWGYNAKKKDKEREAQSDLKYETNDNIYLFKLFHNPDNSFILKMLSNIKVGFSDVTKLSYLTHIKVKIYDESGVLIKTLESEKKNYQMKISLEDILNIDSSDKNKIQLKFHVETLFARNEWPKSETFDLEFEKDI